MYVLLCVCVSSFEWDYIYFRFSIRKVANWPVVRDLAEFSGQQIIFAQDTNMQVANKNIKDEQLKIIHSLKVLIDNSC